MCFRVSDGALVWSSQRSVNASDSFTEDSSDSPIDVDGTRKQQSDFLNECQDACVRTSVSDSVFLVCAHRCMDGEEREWPENYECLQSNGCDATQDWESELKLNQSSLMLETPDPAFIKCCGVPPCLTGLRHTFSCCNQTGTSDCIQAMEASFGLPTALMALTFWLTWMPLTSPPMPRSKSAWLALRESSSPEKEVERVWTVLQAHMLIQGHRPA
jgi:hypothetical protein